MNRRPNASTVLAATALVVAVLGGTPLGSAAGGALANVTRYAQNADKVDGRHAVGAGASKRAARGKLVATQASGGGAGMFAPRFIPKVMDAERLDGLDHTEFQRRRWAEVGADGGLLAGRRVASAERRAVGSYRVLFDEPIMDCAKIVTLVTRPLPEPMDPGVAVVGSDPGGLFRQNGILVKTWNLSGAPFDHAFYVAVIC